MPQPYRTGSSLLGSAATATSGRTWLFGASAKHPGTVLTWTGKTWGRAARLPFSPYIAAAVAVGASDAWAFGSHGDTGEIGAPYAAHYAGGTWKQVRVPLVATLGSHASATSASDIWVAGENPETVAAETMVFNGRAWRTIPLPASSPVGSGVVEEDGIAAVSAANAWILAGVSSATSADPVLYLMHWTGRSWKQIRVPYRSIAGGVTSNLALDGRGGLWMDLIGAVGTGAKKTLKGYLVHYAGGVWSRVAVPVSPGYQALDITLARIPGTRSLWAVGMEGSVARHKSRMFVLRYRP